MERKIYAIGDSHSLRCFEKHPVIADSTIWHGYNKLDGKTAYKLRDHERILRKTILPLREKSLIFCFGEVDVRIHIQRKHEQTGTPTHLLLQRTATRYLELVKELRLEGFDIHVFNVIPTGDFHGAKFEAWQRGLHYPFTTTFEERDHYTLSLSMTCTEAIVVGSRFHL